ncbi:MAG: hydrogenase expression protein HypE, partial [Alphaproteobacteria bacterium]
MLIDKISGDRIEEHKPVPRIIVTAETWRMLAGELAQGRAALLGLWGDTDKVHMAL